MKHLILSALFVGAGALPGLAASEDAWADFRTTVESECRTLAEAELGNVAVRVDPFGTETFGVALVTGLAGETPVERICVMDKATRAVELGGELPPPSAAEGPLSFLVPADRADLEGMDTAAARTLDAISGSGEPLDPSAMRIAKSTIEGLEEASSADLPPGRYDCTVYWYGFLDQGARRVGQHQCRLSETEAGVVVEKMSGERLAASVVPTGRRLAYVGRTFLQGQPENAYDTEAPANVGNANFGNKVGLAARDGAALYLLSTQARGMQPKDDTFFEIIALTPAS